MVKYQLIQDENLVFMNWIGKHTYGSCTIRGTFLHFQPQSAKFFHDIEESQRYIYGNDYLDDDCNLHVDKNTNMESFLTGCCVYRCYDFNEALKIKIEPIDRLLEIMNNKLDRGTYVPENIDDPESLYVRFIDYFERFRSEITRAQGFSIFRDDSKLLYVFKYDEIMRELQKIQTYALENGVFQEWY